MAFGKKEREAVSLQITKTENEKLKARVGELEGEVERLNRELERYRKDEANIAKALLFAQTRVEEMNRSAEKEFGTVRQAYLRGLHDLERSIRQRRGELKLLEESAARILAGLQKDLAQMGDPEETPLPMEQMAIAGVEPKPYTAYLEEEQNQPVEDSREELARLCRELGIVSGLEQEPEDKGEAKGEEIKGQEAMPEYDA